MRTPTRDRKASSISASEGLAAERPEVLRVEHVAKNFGPVVALRGINLHLHEPPRAGSRCSADGTQVWESTDASIADGGEDAFVMFSRNRRRPELSLVMGYLRELRQQARVATGAGVAPVTRREATTRRAALGAPTEAGVKRRQ